MKGKSYYIALGMLLKKYNCSKCGARLQKEKTHRVVTKDDVDYYQYQEVGTYPRRDFDVYEHRFKCPSCGSRISFGEQCIIARIQRKLGRTVLTPDRIKENYDECKKADRKSTLVHNILFTVIANIIVFSLLFVFVNGRTFYHFAVLAALFACFTALSLVSVVKVYKGTGKMGANRSYSYEEKSLMEKLHAYSSHNKETVERADKCYCFHCVSSFNSSEVDRFLSEEETALCPRCGIDAVIPDSIDEALDEEIISRMNKYWF